MPKLGSNVAAVSTIEKDEREILKRLCNDLDVNVRDVVVLKYKKSARHRTYDPQKPETKFFRRYLFRRNGAIYEMYLDIDREPGDNDPVGMWAEAVLVDFPTQEMTIRFAQIAARRQAAGGLRRLLPVGHPDHADYVEAEPDITNVNIDKVSIETRGGVDLMEGSAPELVGGEAVDNNRANPFE